MAPARRLLPEQLEDRMVPATFGVPWPDAPHLTLSFAPDGTAAAGRPSVLFRTLDARLPTHTWQEEIVRAFRTWAAAAGVNVAVVPDGGEPFGTLGLKQGDLRFGDIRIGALPLGADTLAVADPYDPFIADTSVGDIYLNSNVDFSVGGANGSYDLFSVLLHEAGHVLSLSHSSDPSSPMFERYAVRTGLTPGDAAALRALYGPRPPGAPGFSGGDDGAAAGTAPSPGGRGVQLLATTPGYVEHTYYEAVDEVSSAAPARTYRVLSPDVGAGLVNVMTVAVNSLGDGNVPLRATVRDARGNRVDATVIDDRGGSYEIQIRGVLPASEYDVEVMSEGPGGGNWDAEYEVDIDFGLDGRHLQTFVNETLGPGTGEDVRVLRVVESQQFQFVLSATDWGAAAATGVRMTILDAAGREVFTLAAASGASRFGEVFLDRGTYSVQFTRDPRPGATLTSVLFELSGLSESEPLGPPIRDTTLAPVEPSAAAAVPAPSFFWSLAGPSNSARGGMTPRRPPGAGPVFLSGAAGALTGTPLPVPAAAQTSGADDRLVPPAGLEGGGVPVPAPPRATTPGGALPFGAGANVGRGTNDPADPDGPREKSPAAVSDVGLKGTQTSAPAQGHDPDPGGPPGWTEASPGTAPPKGAADGGAPQDQPPARSAGAMRAGQLIWALGLGAAALGWLKLRAGRWGGLVPAADRFVARRVGEDDPSGRG